MARLGTIKEASALLGVSAATLRRWDREGRLKAVRHKGNRYRLYDLDALRPEDDPAHAGGSELGLSPVGRGPFVGRAAALAEIADRFRDGARIVTVVGTAGVGKSRAVRELAANRPRWLIGATWAIDLEGRASEEDVRVDLGSRLGFHRSGVMPASVERLGALLEESGPGMVLVDNADALSKAARGSIDRMGELAPSIVWLAAARSPLGLSGEALYELGPLATEPNGGEALELFHATCRALDIPLVAADRRAAVEIVRALEGLPLSIEIAAARCAVVAPSVLLDELRHEDDWRSFSRHAAAGRDSLAAVIGGALTSLDPALRRALVALATCKGGFDGETARALLPAGRAEDLLAALRHRSLLHVAALPDGRRRFRVDASVSRVALASCPRAERDRAMDRHARHFVALGEAAAESIRRIGDASSKVWLGDEHANLLAVVERAKRDGLPRPLGARALLALEPRWLPEGRARAFVDLQAELAKGRSPRTLYPVADHRIRAVLARGYAYGLLGRPADSRRVLGEAARMASRLRRPILAAEARLILSIRYRQQGELQRSLQLIERSAATLARTPYRRIHAMSQAFAGLVLLQLGDLDASHAKNERARALFRSLDDPEMEGLALGNLAQVDQERGAFERARIRFEQALVCLRAAGVEVYIASYVGLSAMLDHEMDQLEAARAGYDEGIRSLAAQGVEHVEALLAAHRGALRAALGEEAGALEDFDRAESAFSRGGLATFGRALDLHRGQLDVRWARGAFARGDAKSAHDHLERAKRRLREAGAPGETHAFDARFAQRLLARAIAQTAPREVLHVGPRAAWFQLEGQPRVELANRPPLCRLLTALTQRRGQARSVQELVALGWPGEKVLAAAGRRRVQVAISTLRRLGLEDRLSTAEGGYAIDPSIALQLASTGSEGRRSRN